MNCTRLIWSSSSIDELGASKIVCSIAIICHLTFWLEFSIFSTVRQRSMMWLYIYLITDAFILIRFFMLYIMRELQVCLDSTIRTVLCYFEASSKFYMNAVQSYILLAFNTCRYFQIVFNRNVFVENIHSIILSAGLIGILPAINVTVQFLTNWTFLWRQVGEACDIQYESIYVQVFNIVLIYLIPVTSNLILIGFCIQHVSSTKGIRSQQIIERRRKHHRTLLFQTIIFYSIWFILWSPYILAFQFVNVNSTVGVYTALLNYVQIAIDPIVVATLDVRFVKPWQIIWQKLRRRTKRAIIPAVIT